jgi:hypothetical protein
VARDGGGGSRNPSTLNSHHRDALAQILRHPLSHNIEWHSILWLLNAACTVQETHKAHLLATVGSETETFEPRLKDVDAAHD